MRRTLVIALGFSLLVAACGGDTARRVSALGSQSTTSTAAPSPSAHPKATALPRPDAVTGAGVGLPSPLPTVEVSPIPVVPTPTASPHATWPPPSIPSDGYALPWWGDPTKTGWTTAALTGTISGDASSKCVWLGSGSGKSSVEWPNDYWARFNPVRVYNEKGQMVWQEGQTRNDVGGGGRDGYPKNMPAQCRVGGETAWINPIYNPGATYDYGGPTPP